MCVKFYFSSSESSKIETIIIKGGLFVSLASLNKFYILSYCEENKFVTILVHY